eukprot:m.109512 g.109512  ORF g.109512 m.109512 type:complete len:87 (+) comp14003_c3_seq4:1542-1802(+)
MQQDHASAADVLFVPPSTLEIEYVYISGLHLKHWACNDTNNLTTVQSKGDKTVKMFEQEEETNKIITKRTKMQTTNLQQFYSVVTT